jgi:hypothetical protein
MRTNLLILGSCLSALTALAVAGEPKLSDAGPASADECLEQFHRSGPWIECGVKFEPDARSREAIIQMTSGMIRNANCRTDVRLERRGLIGTYLVGGVLQLQPHEVLCELQTEAFMLPGVKITVAPRVTFLNQTVIDVSLGIVSIAEVPPFVVALINDAAESKFVRRQLTKALDDFLRQALSK